MPKREKARILAAMQLSSNSKCQEKAAVAELEDDQRLVASVVRAHLETCDFTSDKVAPTLARAREQPNYTLCHPTLVSTAHTYNYNVGNPRNLPPGGSSPPRRHFRGRSLVRPPPLVNFENNRPQRENVPRPDPTRRDRR